MRGRATLLAVAHGFMQQGRLARGGRGAAAGTWAGGTHGGDARLRKRRAEGALRECRARWRSGGGTRLLQGQGAPAGVRGEARAGNTRRELAQGCGSSRSMGHAGERGNRGKERSQDL
jgi:hypothetical protein